MVQDAIANPSIWAKISPPWLCMNPSSKIFIKKTVVAATAPASDHLPAVPVVMSAQSSTPTPINVLESLYDAVVLTSLSGAVQECNHRAMDLMGYSRDELSGLTISRLVTGITTELLKTIEQQLNVGRFTVMEGRCTRKNGSMFPAEIAVSSVELPDGRGFCFSLRNITQRREMQNRLRLAQNAMHSSASALVMADLASKLQYVNPAFCRMWAVEKPENVIGKSMDELFGADNADKLRACLENKEPWIGELAFPRGEGGELHVQATSAPNIDHQNVLVGMVLSFIDITQRKLAEEKIRREVEAQLQRARQQKDFSGQLNIIALPELIQFIDTSGKTGRLEVMRAGDEAKAILNFEVGRIVSARCGDLQGETAFYATLRFNGHSFTFHQDAEFEKDASITQTTMGLLLEGLRHLDEAAHTVATPTG